MASHSLLHPGFLRHAPPVQVSCCPPRAQPSHSAQTGRAPFRFCPLPFSSDVYCTLIWPRPPPLSPARSPEASRPFMRTGGGGQGGRVFVLLRPQSSLAAATAQ